MPVFFYHTIEKPAEGLYKEKGSKFLAFAYPVGSEEEIREKLGSLRKQHYDARHHCYAWVIGPDKKRYRAFDDGEPNHSAGDPILGQIRSKDLTNLLVVVVRYFGGTKLGVGGLISAYKTAAEDALNNAVLIEKEVFKEFRLHYPYSSTPEVMRMVKEFEINILHQDFSETCSMEGNVPLRLEKKFIEKVALMKAMGSAVELKDSREGD
jgi:uncharacterized YigZ family protein